MNQLMKSLKKNIFLPWRKIGTIDKIIDVFVGKENFLVLGHLNPDEDCVSSMVGTALIIKKFNKNVALFFPSKLHDNFQYLIKICEFNSITLLRPDNIRKKIAGLGTFDAVIICDTAKPSMIQSHELLDPVLRDSSMLKIEIDHHLGGDSSYIGSEGFRLVTDATSASELVGQILLRLSKKEKFLKEYHIGNPFSRNLILAVLTGIIGDTDMGKYLKTRKTRRYYRIFSSMYDGILNRETIKATNLSSMEDISHELKRLTAAEEVCYNFMMARKKFTKSFGYVVVRQGDFQKARIPLDNDIIVSTSRAVADALAEESGKLSLVAYYDLPGVSELVQLRVRRCHSYKEFDVRRILEMFSIENGGGHEGAMGFRVDQGTVEDIDEFVRRIIEGIEKAIG